MRPVGETQVLVHPRIQPRGVSRQHHPASLEQRRDGVSPYPLRSAGPHGGDVHARPTPHVADDGRRVGLILDERHSWTPLPPQVNDLLLHVRVLHRVSPRVEEEVRQPIRPPHGDRRWVVTHTRLPARVDGHDDRKARGCTDGLGERVRRIAPGHPLGLEHPTTRRRGPLLVQRREPVRADLTLLDARHRAEHVQRLTLSTS